MTYPRNRTWDQHLHNWYYPAVDEEWKLQARCRGEDPTLFFPVLDKPDAHNKRGTSRRIYNQRVRKAQEICLECPVIGECLSYALKTDTRHGVWGGTTEMDRARLNDRKRAY